MAPPDNGVSDANKLVPHTQFHRDGSVWAQGHKLNGQPDGYWEWFRLDGTMMRSGTFESGVQVGEWITYDKNGIPYKTTVIKPR
jgi:antitoxin component YwqK of YwqJK toxin-antitoxin module